MSAEKDPMRDLLKLYAYGSLANLDKSSDDGAVA